MDQRNQIKFNPPQQKFVLHRPHSATSIWSRGTGKTWQIGYLMYLINELMPRSTWAMTAANYKQIRTVTLKSALSALSLFGMLRDKHYVVNRKPPADWLKPIVEPIDYENCITTCHGVVFQFISLVSENRGLNVDGIIGDEALTFHKDHFDKGIKKANRGNLKYAETLWRNAWFHHGVFLFSSMPYGENKWLLESSNYYEYNFRDIRRQIAKAELALIDSKEANFRLSRFREIEKLKRQLRFHKSKSGFYYSEADIFDNIRNVGIRYIEQERATSLHYTFMVEVLNYSPDQVDDGFYPGLDRDIHGYRNAFDSSYIAKLPEGDKRLDTPDSRQDSDCIKRLPLKIGVDWGSKFNCIVTAQYSKSVNELRFIKNIYVKYPEILDDLAAKWCAYYQHHPTKRVEFCYDVAGNTSMANSKLTYAQQFTKILRAHGWNVMAKSKTGINMQHMKKFLLWSKVLKEEDPKLPRVKFNLDNCNEAIVSMSNAPAKESSRGTIEKNKSSERQLIPQEEATHLSDAVDMILIDTARLSSSSPSDLLASLHS